MARISLGRIARRRGSGRSTTHGRPSGRAVRPATMTPVTSIAGAHAGRARRVLALTCVVALALNLRAVVSSVGVSLDALMPALSMSGATAGLLTTLPVLSFAFFGVAGTGIARAVGLHRTAAASLAALTLGMAIRPFTENSTLFIAATTVALAGAATGNVILPPLVKAHFPERIGAITAVYSAALLLSGGLPPAVTVPISDAAGDWRVGLLAWAVLAGCCLLPWLAMLRSEVHLGGGGRDRSAFSAVSRSPIGWAMALFFGVQASNAYVQLGWLAPMYIDAGLSPTRAGLMVSIIQALGIPIALALPQVGRLLPDRLHVLLPITFSLVCVAGWLGVMAAPAAAPWLWAALLGIGGASFPWMLSMIGLRSTSTRGAAALSGFVQPVGYLIAAIGPFAVGALHDATGSWTPPLLALAGASCLMLVGVAFARPRTA